MISLLARKLFINKNILTRKTSEAQRNYIKNRVLDMEKAVSGNNFKDPEVGFRAYFDTLSLMDFYIAQELSKNVDGYRRCSFLQTSDSENPDLSFLFGILILPLATRIMQMLSAQKAGNLI